MITQSENPVRESSYEINLGGSGVSDITTEKINGTLKSIIIDMGKALHLSVSIFLREYPFAEILTTQMKQSKVFHPVKVNTGLMGAEYEIPSRQEWALNDNLGIHLEGPTNAIIKVVIRYG